MGAHRRAIVAAVLSIGAVACAPPVRQIAEPPDLPLAVIWEQTDVSAQDTYYGPWGRDSAPDPAERYTFDHLKHTGVNPGLTVRDSRGRKWNVKQASSTGYAPEGPIEVAVSRILSAVGYKQPPVYYLPSFTLLDDWGERIEAGGRFRLDDRSLKDRGTWSWQQNPFVGSQPYQGLLVILLMFNETDLKNSNNSLYDSRGDEPRRWFVVRDIGTALGSTGRFAPRRGDPDAFDREPFIVGVRDGFVEFGYRGRHQELMRGTLRPSDVAWAGDELARLSPVQWDDAFRAGGFRPAVADRFIRRMREKIAEARAVGTVSNTDRGRR